MDYCKHVTDHFHPDTCTQTRHYPNASKSFLLELRRTHASNLGPLYTTLSWNTSALSKCLCPFFLGKADPTQGQGRSHAGKHKDIPERKKEKKGVTVSRIHSCHGPAKFPLNNSFGMNSKTSASVHRSGTSLHSRLPPTLPTPNLISFLEPEQPEQSGRSACTFPCSSTRNDQLPAHSI